MPKQALLLETIKSIDGAPLHLEYHQQRVDYSRQELGYHSSLTLTLHPPASGLYRCRILYQEGIEKLEYIPYEERCIRNFKLLHSDISYDLKYADRSDLDTLYKQKGSADEIIIVKNGLITDTSISNLCFFDGNEWLTPKTPLLRGTTRQRFLDKKRIKESDISYKEIQRFKKIALLNAMIDFKIIEDAIIS